MIREFSLKGFYVQVGITEINGFALGLEVCLTSQFQIWVSLLKWQFFLIVDREG